MGRIVKRFNGGVLKTYGPNDYTFISDGGTEVRMIGPGWGDFINTILDRIEELEEKVDEEEYRAPE